MRADLPEPLLSQHEAIIKRFENVKDTYSLYADGMIPEDPECMKLILEFLVQTLDYMDIHHEKLDLLRWGTFLCEFRSDFEYGDPEDSHNYLDSSELDIISNLEGFGGEEAPDLKRIISVRKKFEKALKQMG